MLKPAFSMFKLSFSIFRRAMTIHTPQTSMWYKLACSDAPGLFTSMWLRSGLQIFQLRWRIHRCTDLYPDYGYFLPFSSSLLIMPFPYLLMMLYNKFIFALKSILSIHFERYFSHYWAR